MPSPEVLLSPRVDEALELAAIPSLEWLINPISAEVFLGGYWEKRPFVVQRRQTE